jgi:hydroxymethylpyrimidine/phosphomethylpyrimidine kinase
MGERIQDAKSVPSNQCPADLESCLFAEICDLEAYSCMTCQESQSDSQEYKPDRETITSQLEEMLEDQQINYPRYWLGMKGVEAVF